MARSPPCTAGCRVLTRPSIISGKPVSSDTSRTASPASLKRLARAAGRDQFDAIAGKAHGRIRQCRICRRRRAGRATARRRCSVMMVFIFILRRTAQVKRDRTKRKRRLPVRHSGSRGSSSRVRRAAPAVASAAARRLLEAPDHPRRRARVSVDDHLHCPARAFVAGKINAVFELYLVFAGAEGPRFLGRRHQQHAVAVGQPRRLDGRVQMKAHRVAGPARCAFARCRRRRGINPRLRISCRRRRASSCVRARCRNAWRNRHAHARISVPSGRSSRDTETWLGPPSIGEPPSRLRNAGVFDELGGRRPR